MTHRRWCPRCTTDHHDGITHDCQNERCPNCRDMKIWHTCETTSANG